MIVRDSWRRCLLCAGLVAWAGGPALGAAPLGTEFQINTRTTDFQRAADVGVAADGSFVVVWMSNNQDGAYAGVFGQRYDGTGARIGVEFQVNGSTLKSEVYPRIAIEADGDFVVVWVSSASGYGYEIDGQRFASTGARLGSEFMINTYVTSNHRYPAVAIDGDGDFIVAWQSYEQEGVFNFGGIYAQRFNSSGAKVGGEFHVNSYIPKVQGNASVAAETNGDFVIVWDSRGDPDNTVGVRAQRYTSAGAALGGEFAVNTYTTGAQYQATMAMDSDGDFVVVWVGNKPGGYTEIFAQRFSSNGSALSYRVPGQYLHSRLPGAGVRPGVATRRGHGQRW